MSDFKLVSSIGNQLAWKQVSGFKLVSSIGHQLAWQQVSGFELVSSIGKKLACAYSEDTNQSAHPHSLIRVLVSRLMKRWKPGYQESTH